MRKFDKYWRIITRDAINFIVFIVFLISFICFQGAEGLANKATKTESTTAKTMSIVKVSQNSSGRKVKKAKKKVKYKYIKKQIKCRKKPSKKAKKVGTFSYNKKVKVLKRSKNKKWYLVKGRAKNSKKKIKGYVHKKYLSNKKLPKKKKTRKKVYIGTFKITFYCACATCNGNTHGITASGAPLRDGVTIAVNRREIPLGTKVYIEGYGNRIAQDTGAFGSHTIDMFVRTSHRNLYGSKYGVKWRKVYKYVKK